MHDPAEFGRADAPELIPWASHVRWAVEDEILYVLDLRTSAYLSMPLSKLRANWDAAQRQFGRRCLLHPPNAARLNSAIAHVGRGEGGFGSFWASTLWARHIMRRRALVAGSNLLQGADHSPDARTIALVERFQNWRPLYPRASLCLFDSLALGRFLWSAGIRSKLVYGVRGGPFSAHAWLEIDGAIVNDDPEYCAGFTPMRRP